MDNNNQTPVNQPQPSPQPMGQQPVTLEQQSPQQMGNMPPSEESHVPNKTVLYFVIGLIVVVVLALAGYYYYLNTQKSQQPPPQSQIPSPSPASTLSQLEDELNSITVVEVDEEFTQVDQDLQSL